LGRKPKRFGEIYVHDTIEGTELLEEFQQQQQPHTGCLISYCFVTSF